MDVLMRYFTFGESCILGGLLFTYMCSLFSFGYISTQKIYIKENTDMVFKSIQKLEDIKCMLDKKCLLPNSRVYEELFFYKDNFEKEVDNIKTVISNVINICDMNTYRSSKRISDIKDFLSKVYEIHNKKYIGEELDERDTREDDITDMVK